MARIFSRQDVIEINEKMLTKVRADYFSLSDASQKIVRETSFSAEEINSAFKEARRRLAGKNE